MSTPLKPQLERLANGLELSLLQVLDCPRAAAWVRVRTGSHDAPLAYPGLAHFLEHLLFLGSAGFAVEDGLLAYARACAGQVNASTRERGTEYFFEVPASRLEGGLARLCDMLAAPNLDPAAQLREREVLQAEFVARGQDRDTLCDAALGQAVAPGHPFAAFHAGHRDSLPVEQVDFQQALGDFHRRFYHAGQITLVLVGPQPVAELRELAQRHGGLLRAAPAVAQASAPSLLPLRAQALRLQVPAGLPRLSLGFVLEALPAGLARTVEFLATWLGHEAEGGLLESLRRRGWCEAVQARLAYQHAGQAVLVIELELTAAGARVRGALRGAVLDWLAFFADQGDWGGLREDYAAIARWQLDRDSPLALARHLGQGPEAEAPVEATMVRALLTQLQPSRLIELGSATRPITQQRQAGFVLSMGETRPAQAAAQSWAWRLPPANPMLQAPGPWPTAAPCFDGMRWLEGPTEQGRSMAYLRWAFAPGTPAAGLFEVLQVALRPGLQLARQAGFKLHWENQGQAWQLQVSGVASALPGLLSSLAPLLCSPPDWAWAQGRRLYREQACRAASEGPLRRLWQRLPELFQAPGPAPAFTRRALDRAWRHGRLQGLVVGLPAATRAAFDSVLWAMPGQAGEADARAPSQAAGYHWREAGLGASETAVLLFCPLPAADAETEAAWRLLAALLESPFYQRLRSELQLGYGVYAGFRQVGSRQGLLFAVQSPTAGVLEIIGHIQAFLAGYALRLAALEPAQLNAARANLLVHLLGQSASVAGLAEQSWSALLAGQGVERPQALQAALQQVSLDQLANQYQALLEARGGWFVLADGACPAGPWQPA